MALTGAKPFLKNISTEIHSKALADNTQTIISLKTERNTTWQEHKLKCKHHGESSFLVKRPTSEKVFSKVQRRREGGANSSSSSFVRHRIVYK